MSSPTVLIAATFTTDPLQPALAFWLRTLGLPHRIQFAPYNQVFQQLLDLAGEFAQNSNGVNIILLRLEDGLGDVSTQQDLLDALQTAAQRSNVPYLLLLCPPTPGTPAAQFDRFETTLVAGLDDVTGIHLVTPAQLFDLYPVALETIFDPYAEQLGHVPFTPLFFTALGAMLARKIYALHRPPAKVIVLDGDNTLWGGVAGEVGPEGIDLTGPWQQLQTFMAAQTETGRLLCLCSKNQAADVWAVFDHYPELPLRPEHLIASRINWRPKSKNLQSLAQELQLGLDSFIFIDDNPLECAEVRANCPQVLTLQLPPSEQIPRFLTHCWAFDTLQVTETDRQRTKMYRQNREREELRAQVAAFADFLTRLNLKVNISPLTPEHLPRVSQLTQRTNQFNATTIRRTENEILHAQQDDSLEALVVEVSDRFGDYGLVGALFFAETQQALRVDTFLLSCRSLGRGIEHRMLARLGAIAQERGLLQVDIPFSPTAHNRPMLDFLTGVGSNFARETETGLGFQIPAAVAAAVKFTPSSAAPEPAPRPVALENGEEVDQTNTAGLLTRIALELADVPQIHAAVQQFSRHTRPDTGPPFVPPQSAAEKKLAALWADILQLDRVGVNDNFFELGGNSLLATQLASRLVAEFGVALDLLDLFNLPVLSAQARRLAENAPAQSQPLLPTSLPRPAEPPLSFAQQRLWFLHQLRPGNPAYNIPFVIQLAGPLDVSALQRSLTALVNRYESLRTAFPAPNGVPVQRISPPPDTFDLPVIDLAHLPATEQNAEVSRLAEAEVRRQFDLAVGPLFCASLLQLAPEQHIFLLNMHHIISDGWSMRLFFQELSQSYRNFVASQPVSLPNLPWQYADFALWQREWLAADSAVRQQQLAYWQQQLAHLSTLPLPTDHPRPAQQTFQGHTYRFALPPFLADALRALSHQEGVTLFMTLLAAFQVLLSHYSGQTDVPVGSPIANRHYEKLENLIGFFVNTLVLRTDLSGQPSFKTLLQRVRRVVLDASRRQDLPFDQLVEALQPERDPGRQPLFQVMFSLENEPPLQDLNLPHLAAALLPVDSGATQFDLSLELTEEVEGLTAEIEYNTALFDPSTIERMAGHWQTLLAGIIADPDCPISRLPLLTPAEQRQMVIEWNKLDAPPPSRTCFIHLFECQVKKTPQAVALIAPDAGQSLTYADLNRRANQVAHYLRGLGVGPETIVGLCLERSVEMVVGVLGILKAGAAYVPLDPEYPPDRLAFMLADTQAPVLLIPKKIYDSQFTDYDFLQPDENGLPIINPKSKTCTERSRSIVNPIAVCLDSDWDIIARQSDQNPTSGTTPDNLAYVMYTSGSTGQPKGVMVEQHSLAWYAQTAAAMYGVTAADRVLQFSSISFDISVEEIYPCLAQGGTLLLRSEAMRGSAAAFLDECRRWDITTLFLPTAFWHELAAALAAEPWRLPESLRLVSFGGEKVSPERVAAWQQTIGERVQLCNGYGPTETTVVATLCRLIPPDSQHWRPSSIGRPIAGAQVYLFDANLQPIPIGVPGELYIGGEGVARGYLNQPDLTELNFISNPLLEHPFIPHPSSFRLYRSGDLARYAPDGSIEYLGRSDRQVKIRGFRVELSEIEHILTQHPAVQDAVVTVQAQAGPKRLVAYVILTSPIPVTTPYTFLPAPLSHELDQFLKEKLPYYMLPTAVVALETLPLTPNGKVDRQALPPVDLNLRDTYLAPRGPVETTLAEIWQEVLGLERVGVYDNFFELGGDSILSIQIIARASRAGLHLSPAQIFEHQTIAALARAADTTACVEAEQGLITGPVLFTPIQHWFFAQDFADPHYWHMPALFEIDTAVDVDLLSQTLGHLLRHHDALRLRFEQTGSGWRQVNAGGWETTDAVKLTHVDLSTWPETGWAAAMRQAAERLQQEVNLTTGPLVRAGLFTAGPDAPRYLLLVVHHLAVDGVSWRILQEDLNTVYYQLVRGEPVRLPPKTTSFKQWSAKLNETAAEEWLQTEVVYWLNALPDKVASLPVDDANWRDNTEARARVEMITLDQATTRQLLAASQTLGAQVNEILLAALAQMLAEWLGEAQPCLIDLEGHGREEIVESVDLSRTVGWFTTIFPVCLQINREATPLEVIKSAQSVLRAVPRRGIGYGLLRYLGQNAELTAKPQAQVSFNYLGQFVQKDDSIFRPVPFWIARRLVGATRGPANKRSHLLEIDAYVVTGQLQVAWVYNHAIHRQATIAVWANRFMENLQKLLAYSRQIQNTGEDVYPLSPLQQVMGAAAGEYVVQWHCVLRGPLDVAAFRQAWQQVVNRHPALRTAFDRAKQTQTVQGVVDLPWLEQDWQTLPEFERQSHLEEFLTADRARGFDLDQAPLLRLALLQLAADTFQFVWTHHHLILDGWSFQPLWQEVWQVYRALRGGITPDLPPPIPYRRYIEWLQQQNGLAPPDTRFSSMGEGGSYVEQRLELSQKTSVRLQAFVAKRRLTLNTVMQGIWVLTLRSVFAETPVNFDVVVSDRAADTDFEAVVGLLLKVQPVQVDAPAEAEFIPWLQTFQQRWQKDGSAEKPGSSSPGSLLRFQNYPAAGSASSATDEIEISNIGWVDRWPYPLNLEIVPGEALLIQLSYQTNRFTAQEITQILERFEILAQMMAGNETLPMTIEQILTELKNREN